MSKHFPKPETEIELDPSNYGTKADLKNRKVLIHWKYLT